MTNTPKHYYLLSIIFTCILTFDIAYGDIKKQIIIDEIYTKYELLQNETDISELVKLHYKLEKIIQQIQSELEDKFNTYYKKEYYKIGLDIGHYSGFIGYSGKLLVEAHKINPNSQHRERTLFTTILGEATSHGLGEMPDIKQAEIYLKEFPNGYYAWKAHEILGGFYHDLYNVLLALHNKDKYNADDIRYINIDATYDCYSPFIQKNDIPEQKNVLNLFQ